MRAAVRLGALSSACLQAAALMSTAPGAIPVAPLAGAVSRIQLAAPDSPGRDAAASMDRQAVETPSSGEPSSSSDSTLVQFVVVRRDLLKTMEWPVGSVIAQACHACTAVTWACRDDADVQAYLADLGGMHKVVKECKGETQLQSLAAKLTEEGITFHLWVEQPENIPTAIALKPYPRDFAAPLLKKFQLFK
jgi:peptidyl-tRNA hydrolase